MILRMVRIERIDEYRKQGWVLSAPLGQPHGEYSVIMEFPEEWRPVVGFENLYEVSNHGRVRGKDRMVFTVARNGRQSQRLVKGTLRKYSYDRGGYLQVSLHAEGKNCTKKVAGIVARAFIGARPIGADVCHNDGCRTNNMSYNLRYDSRAGNMADAMHHGTIALGESRPQSKLTEKDIRKIRVECKSRAISDVAKELGIGRSAVSAIIRRKTWSHIPLMPGEIGTPEGDAERADFISRHKVNVMRANLRLVCDCQPGEAK